MTAILLLILVAVVLWRLGLNGLLPGGSRC